MQLGFILSSPTNMFRKTEKDRTISIPEVKEMLLVGQRMKIKKNGKSRGIKRKRNKKKRGR